jgi:predicted CxxxxCH...CXXCH cytochrome family protein
MRKKAGSFILVMLMCAVVPVLAQAWQLAVRVNTVGGSISVRGGTPITSVTGTKYYNYTTGAATNIPVAVTPASSCYAISYEYKDGSSTSLSPLVSSLYFAGPSNHSLVAYFAAKQITVSASVNPNSPGGSVTPANSYTFSCGSPTSTDLVYNFVPSAGNYVTGITNIPSSAMVTPSGTGPWPVGQTVTVTIPKAAAANLTASGALVGSFSGVSVNAGAPQTVFPNTNVTLQGSATPSAGATYSWTVTGPAAVSLYNANTATPNFTPTVAGTYYCTLSVNGGVATAKTTVNVTDSAASSSRSGCANCHIASGMSPVPYTNWSASRHKVALILCANCHVGSDSGGHPGPALSSLANVCRNCHADSKGNVPNHPFPIGTNTCVSCHNPHSTVGSIASAQGAPHYNNITTAGYPASYVTSRATCEDCHIDDSATTNLNAPNRHAWAQSGHANVTDAPWTAYDFKTRTGCVQCHTTTGFIAYSTGKVTAAWGVASDKTKEVLTCVGCHKDIATGEVRSVTPVKPFADDGYVNRNVGTSNICMDCHSGRNNGKSITKLVGSADLASTSFVPPHYLAAGGVLHGQGGYNFPGQTYAFYSSNSHRMAGLGNFMNSGAAGPCVACHKNTAGHTFRVVTAGTLPSVCANCHGASMAYANLSTARSNASNALSVLNAALANQGYGYSTAYPYFTNPNWGTDQAGANKMGAGFNYVLLLKEPGAYAHNAAYEKQLIINSIDAVSHGGTVTGHIDDVLASLVSANAITQSQADSLAAYQASSSCATCHTNTSGSHTAHLNNSAHCADCHSATAATDTTLVPGTATHLNGVKDVVLAAGGSYGGGSCSGVYCHSNGRGTYQSPGPLWGGAKMTCASCHPTLGGAHAAHVGDLLGNVTFYNFTGNYSSGSMYRFGCANCHPTDNASHRNGKVDVTLVPDAAAGTLRSKNSPTAVISGVGNTGSGIAGTPGTSVVCSAAYCHSNGWANGTLVYANSPDWYNAAAYTGDKCAMCHGNSPNSTYPTTPGSPAHGKHVVSIHAGQVYDGNGNLLPAAQLAGINAGHGDPAQATTLNCDICHSNTVTNDANDNSSACSSCHANSSISKGTPVINTASHVNGSVDVAFKDIQLNTKAQVRPASFAKYSGVWTRTTYKVDAGSHDTSKSSLKSGLWNVATESCANVACHNGSATAPAVKWNITLSCVDCHSSL